MLYVEHTNESKTKENNSLISMLYVEYTETIVIFCLKHRLTVKSGSVAYRARKYSLLIG